MVYVRKMFQLNLVKWLKLMMNFEIISRFLEIMFFNESMKSKCAIVLFVETQLTLNLAKHQ